MAKKKKKQAQAKPWCWYCEREFEDEKVLITHQRAKHFKCPQCNKKMNTVGGLVIHYTQVHKETLRSTPNAIKGRDSVEVEIFGMEGIPAADLISFQMRKAAAGEGDALLHQQHSMYKRPRINTDLQQPLSPEELQQQLARHQAISKNGGVPPSPSSTGPPPQTNMYGAPPQPYYHPHHPHAPPMMNNGGGPLPPGHFHGPPPPIAPFGGPSPMQNGFHPHPPSGPLPPHMPPHNPFGYPGMPGPGPPGGPHPHPPMHPMHRLSNGMQTSMISPTMAGQSGSPAGVAGSVSTPSTVDMTAASSQGTPAMSNSSEQNTPTPSMPPVKTVGATAMAAGTAAPASGSAMPVTGTHLVYSDNTTSVEEKRASLAKYRYVEAN